MFNAEAVVLILCQFSLVTVIMYITISETPEYYQNGMNKANAANLK